MSIHFTKMHGLGNDFMVIDGINQSITLDKATLLQWADRHTGVGFDQLLVVEKAKDLAVDFHYRIFNADGTEVAQCGNGARCFARFVHEMGLSTKQELLVSTQKGRLALRLEPNGQVRVNMGVPEFSPAAIPLQRALAERYTFNLSDKTLTGYAVALGNPHFVIQVPSVRDADVDEIGALLACHADFPDGVNVGFMEIINPRQLKLRVYERGVGETQACGSGACAAMVAASRAGLVGCDVAVQLPGGTLQIKWARDNQPIYMQGPAVTVYRGEL